MIKAKCGFEAVNGYHCVVNGKTCIVCGDAPYYWKINILKTAGLPK